MQSQQRKGAIWVRATWITAFLEAALLVFLDVVDVDHSYLLWALIFGGLGFGVFRGNRRSAWWLVIAQWVWTVIMAVSAPWHLEPLYIMVIILVIFIGASVVCTVGALHLRRVSKEATLI